LKDQSAGAHIDNDRWIHESLPMGIKSPDLYR